MQLQFIRIRYDINYFFKYIYNYIRIDWIFILIFYNDILRMNITQTHRTCKEFSTIVLYALKKKTVLTTDLSFSLLFRIDIFI